MSEEKGVTIIEPVSSRFTKVATKLDYKVEITENGEKYDKDIPIQNLKRFPGSRQGPRPYFNGKLGKFKLVKEDGSLYTQEDVDKMVKDVPIAYDKSNAPNPSLEGQLIPSSNIKNWADPYLNSREWVVDLEEGRRTLKDSKFKEKYFADIIRGNPKAGIENEEGIMPGDVEYLIKRPQLAKERKVKKRDLTLVATDLYKGMMTDSVRMVGILRLFNIDIDPATPVLDLQDAVWEKAGDSVTTVAGNTYQKLFVYYATLEPKIFATREILSLGSLRGQIKAKGGMYYFDEIPVGSSIDEMVEYFNNDNNSSRFDALKIMLGIK